MITCFIIAQNARRTKRLLATRLRLTFEKPAHSLLITSIIVANSKMAQANTSGVFFMHEAFPKVILINKIFMHAAFYVDFYACHF